MSRERFGGDAALGDGVAAALPAATLSGAPSTLHALATGLDPWAATLAAGSLLLPHERRRARLVAAAAPIHLAVSLWWSIVLVHLLPRRGTRLAGMLAGLAIATLDIGVIGRRSKRIRELPLLPQLADHLAFGLVVADVTARRRRKRRLPRPASARR